MAADRLGARWSLISPGEPEHERDVHVLLVNGVSLRVHVMRISERLPVIACHNDERVLIEAGVSDRVEKPPEVMVGLVQNIQVAVELVIVGYEFLAQKLEDG